MLLGAATAAAAVDDSKEQESERIALPWELPLDFEIGNGGNGTGIDDDFGLSADNHRTQNSIRKENDFLRSTLTTQLTSVR